jgi:3-dehydroquinate synthase
MANLKERFYARYHQSFNVAFEYPVYFTRDLFLPDNDLVIDALNRMNTSRCHRVAVFVDSGVADTHPALEDQIVAYFKAQGENAQLAAAPVTVAGGENAKNGWAAVHHLTGVLADLHLDRQSYVIAIGGGAVLDMVGFSTAIVHRGLRLIRVPTTTLSQNDAGIGVKNGINAHGQKNFIGTFAPPFAVINDSGFLRTLSFDHWIGGIAEALKVSIIKDAQFFSFLCAHADDFKTRDLPAMEEAVRRCAILHLEHIGGSGDPFEFGSTRPLDFGHWAAHRIEIMSDYRLGHGEAVSIGICIDSYVAMQQGFISEDEMDAILSAFLACGLPVWDEILNQRNGNGRLEIIGGLEQFREHLGGRMAVTLPHGIGKKIEVDHIDTTTVEEGIQFLEARRGIYSN